MSKAEENFVALVGDRIVHRTLAENATGIAACGLLRPSTIAALAGVAEESLALRRERTLLRFGNHHARLNHQKPLLAGRSRAADFLDGHSLQSWACQLDRRVFFWPGRAGTAFRASLDGAGAACDYRLDSRRFFRTFGDLIDLSPINSGSALRVPAKRGDWIYVPAPRAESFRANRRARLGKQSADTVQEISLRADIPPELWSELLAPIGT